MNVNIYGTGKQREGPNIFDKSLHAKGRRMERETIRNYTGLYNDKGTLLLIR